MSILRYSIEELVGEYFFTKIYIPITVKGHQAEIWEGGRVILFFYKIILHGTTIILKTLARWPVQIARVASFHFHLPYAIP